MSRRRQAKPRREEPTQEFINCDACGKRAWIARSSAKAVIRKIKDRAGNMQPYRCPHGTGWHIGHLPPSVRNGEFDRAAYVAQATAIARGEQP